MSKKTKLCQKKIMSKKVNFLCQKLTGYRASVLLPAGIDAEILWAKKMVPNALDSPNKKKN